MSEPFPVEPIAPMLAADGALQAGSVWAFEFVWDGLRVTVQVRADRVKVFSGTGRSVSASYPELAELHRLAKRHGPMVLDGKIVALDKLDRPSVVPLRQRMNVSRPSETLLRRTPVWFYPSDVLYFDGRDTLPLPFRERRELLAQLDLTGLPAKLPPYFVDTDGLTVLHAAERHGLAGVVAKRLDSRYQPGRRTRAWIQTLPRHTQRVVVGGWVGRPGPADGPAALLVGVAGSNGSLRYLGKVGAGLDRRARAELTEQLTRLASSVCPFEELPPEETKSVSWLTPRLVGEVSYRRWEADGRLRHASWLRVLPDAHAASVRGPLAGVTPGEAGEVAEAGKSGEPGDRGGGPSDLAALDEAVRLAQAEVRALRAQISPHFLYNALTTIASYVRTDPDRARELLHAFAEYTRYCFRPGAQPTTLGAELANADRYLTLEGARFGDRLRVERRVAPELHDVELPFLTVQSLVENAVRHGIEGTPRGGTLRISAEPSGTRYCLLTINDDGLGMDPQRLNETISDVRERLAAAPGPASALDVVTAPEVGTTVTVRLPIQPGRLDG